MSRIGIRVAAAQIPMAPSSMEEPSSIAAVRAEQKHHRRHPNGLLLCRGGEADGSTEDTSRLTRSTTNSRSSSSRHWIFLPSIIFTCLIGTGQIHMNCKWKRGPEWLEFHFNCFVLWPIQGIGWYYYFVCGQTNLFGPTTISRDPVMDEPSKVAIVPKRVVGNKLVM